MNLQKKFVAGLAKIVLLASLGTSAAYAQELRLDPGKVKGPDSCGECHEGSLNAWRGTHHFGTFKKMPRSDEARNISDKLGIKRIKTDETCNSCHFTSQDSGGKVKPIGGITCESCHGAGADYIDVHPDFGGADATAASESEAHKKERWKKSVAGGMIRPTDLYALAENCYQCHTVPNEELVNKGGHPAGSPFELVAWSQGEVRHNLWYNDGKENAEASKNRRRVMFVVGQGLDLEYAMRGVSQATEKAQYAVQMAKRAKKSAIQIKALIDAGVSIPEVKALLKIAGSTKFALNNEAALLAAADKVAEQTKAIATKYDGSELAAVDSLLPSASKYKGTPPAP